MITEEMKKLIENNAMGLATVDENGDPHVIAIGDVEVVSDNQLLIGDVYMKETIKNLKHNNKVALVVWNEDWEENCFGYEFRGNTQSFTEGEWLERVKKIHEGFPVKRAILVKVNKIKKI